MELFEKMLRENPDKTGEQILELIDELNNAEKLKAKEEKIKEKQMLILDEINVEGGCYVLSGAGISKDEKILIRFTNVRYQKEVLIADVQTIHVSNMNQKTIYSFIVEGKRVLDFDFESMYNIEYNIFDVNDSYIKSLIKFNF